MRWTWTTVARAIQFVTGAVAFIVGVLGSTVVVNDFILTVMFVALSIATIAAFAVLLLPDEPPRGGKQSLP